MLNPVPVLALLTLQGQCSQLTASCHALPSTALSAIPLVILWTEALSFPLLIIPGPAACPSLLIYTHKNLNFFHFFYPNEHLASISTGYIQSLKENSQESSSAKQNFEQFRGCPLL